MDAENDLEHESVQSMGLNEREQREHGGRAATPESGSAQFALLNSRHPIVVGVGSTMLRVEDETAGWVRGREGLECVTVKRHHWH